MKIEHYKVHPWHGIDYGKDAPEVVRCFIEIVPTDTVKYEVDKLTGYLSIDRPQKYSNIIPALYGFIPRTYSDNLVARLTNKHLGRTDILGDRDPVDICVLTEKAIPHDDIIVNARPVGGFQLLDGNMADDKIIAVLENDAIYGGYRSIKDIPAPVVTRLAHYFTTYKDLPDDEHPRCVLTDIYDADRAHEVIRCAMEDYQIYRRDNEHER